MGRGRKMKKHLGEKGLDLKKNGFSYCSDHIGSVSPNGFGLSERAVASHLSLREPPSTIIASKKWFSFF
jgi:hypothetical protein